MEHVAIGLAEIVSPPPCARLQESRNGPGPRSRRLARDGAPIIGVRGQQTGAPLDALMSFPQLFHRRPTLTDYDVAGMNAVICNFVLVQGSEESAFTNDKHSA